jgi:hypothetical protein
VWVLQKSGDINLMEKLHPLNQNKFANIMHKSPSIFPEEEFELKADDLFNFLDNLRKLEKEEEKRLKEAAKRKLMRKQSSYGFVGTSAFGDVEGVSESATAQQSTARTDQQSTARTDDKQSTARSENKKEVSSARVRGRRGKKK